MEPLAVFDGIKRWARRLRTDVVALALAARDPRVPWHAKAVAALVAAYALSPIDLIPDFIPVLGYLDDLILIPAGIALAVRLIPGDLIDEFRAKAAHRQKERSFAGAVMVVSVWLVTAALLLLWWRGGLR